MLPSASISLPAPTDSRLGESAPKDRGLFGLSARKVYHAFDVAIKAVSSYLTFSPFLRPKKSVESSLFSVALSVPDGNRKDLPVRKYDALCCPDFPSRPNLR